MLNVELTCWWWSEPDAWSWWPRPSSSPPLFNTNTGFRLRVDQFHHSNTTVKPAHSLVLLHSSLLYLTGIFLRFSNSSALSCQTQSPALMRVYITVLESGHAESVLLSSGGRYRVHNVDSIALKLFCASIRILNSKYKDVWLSLVSTDYFISFIVLYY